MTLTAAALRLCPKFTANFEENVFFTALHFVEKFAVYAMTCLVFYTISWTTASNQIV